MRLTVVTSVPRRWPLLVVFLAALAVFWTATAPAGAQDAGETEVPAKPTGLSVDTVPGSLDVSVEWDEVDGAASYPVRWRRFHPDSQLNEGVNDLRYQVAFPGKANGTSPAPGSVTAAVMPESPALSQAAAKPSLSRYIPLSAPPPPPPRLSDPPPRTCALPHRGPIADPS